MTFIVRDSSHPRELLPHEREEALSARDHFGVRPFYYARVGNELIHGTTLEAIRRHPAISARLHDPAIADFVLFGFNQDPQATTFADVRSLAPGHRLVLEGGELRPQRYWSLPVERVCFRRPEEYFERFRKLLAQAVRERLGEGPTAILMSGGIDSPSIAATATAGVKRCHTGRARLEPCPTDSLRAYTITYDTLIHHEERHYAGLVGKHTGIPVQFVPVDGHRLFERWDDPNYHTPEPVDSPLWAMQVDLLRRIAADGYGVALSGEAGDAVSAPVQALPELLATGRLGPLARDILSYWREHGERPPVGMGAWWRRVRARGPAGTAEREESPMLGLLEPGFAKRVGARDRVREHPDAGWAHHELQSPMWPWCALTQSRAWTGADVEVRYPFLDLRLVSFMLSVPSVPWACDKELIRKAMRGLLPEEVLRRRKAPLSEDPVRALFRRDGPPPMPEKNSHVWEFVDRKEFETRYAEGEERAREITRVICLDKWLGTIS